jgi:hypothetical protein
MIINFFDLLLQSIIADHKNVYALRAGAYYQKGRS